MQAVEVPHVELVVQGATEAHADEVGCKQGQQNLCARLRATHTSSDGKV